MKIITCPCGSSLTVDHCCQRYLLGEAAPTAETLMRSRYTAFALHDESYLLSTWHRSTRPTSIPFDTSMKWLGLKIVAANETATAEVEFIARYRVGGGSAARLHERSRFVLEQGRWFYVDGDIIH